MVTQAAFDRLQAELSQLRVELRRIKTTDLRSELSLSWRKISSTVVTGGSLYSSGTIDTKYKTLWLQAHGSRNTGGLTNLDVRFNGDTGSNYRRLVWSVDGAGTTGVDFNDAGTLYRAGQWGSGLRNSFDLVVMQTDDTNPVIQSQAGGRDSSAAADNLLANGQGIYVNGPITSITVFVTNGFNSTTFELWGSV